MQEARVQYLGGEDPLEKEMATHSNILAWRIPWTEELGGLHSMGSQRVGHNRVTNTYTPMAYPWKQKVSNGILFSAKNNLIFLYSLLTLC